MDREAWNDRYRARPQTWSRAPNPAVVAAIENLPPGDALELGCGEGRHALWLASCGWRVTAVDFSDVAVSRARAAGARAGFEIEWRVADVTAPAPGTAFDLVLAAFLHTGPQERRRWLARVREALRPGGTFVYVGHDLSNAGRGAGGPRSTDVLCSADWFALELPDFTPEVGTVVAREASVEPGHGGGAARVALDTVFRATAPIPAATLRTFPPGAT